MRFLFSVFWIMNIMNLPFMEMFDTTYPLNTLFYFLVALLGSFFERPSSNKKKDWWD